MINISWELSLKEKYDEAIEYCGRAVSVDHRYADDAARKISSIGYRLSDEGKYEEAIKFYNKAILANPMYANDVATTLMEISWRLSGEGKHNEAKIFYNLAISFNHNCASTVASEYFHKGCTLSNEGKYGEAIKYYDRATSINPNFKRAWSNKGNTYRKMGAHSETKTCFEKVKAIDEVNLQKREAAKRKIDNKLMEEKQNLEEKFKVILNKNPATLEEFVQYFLSTYLHNYPEHINEFKRLLYLSQKRTSDEIEEAIKSYFTNIISLEGMGDSFHIFESTYNFGLIYEFAKKYDTHFEKSDLEKLNKLLVQRGTRFHDIKVLEDLVTCAIKKQNYVNFKKEMLAPHPSNETQLIKQFIKVSKNDIDANMDMFFMLLLELEITNPSLVEIKMLNLTLDEFKELMSTKIFGVSLISDANERFTINDVDNMDGYEFENFIGSLYEKMGYLVEQTPKSGDQGADLIITKFGERTAVQTKNYRENVSNKAVQEVVASQAFHKCTSCSVVTNSYFTKSAMELGNANGIKLVDREELKVLIDKYM
ncbi:restriction endonuclease [Methanosarcina soligelidi]|uniref:restriction endonuclease n=1 Tax=Methanosarcina soligelidi TaxID=1036677 RepID=UPI0009FE1277|nr:restriction endonuclease [Methanosarcina soligelidi]